MTEFENKIIDSVIRIEKAVSVLVTNQEHHERRLDSHSSDIRMLNEDRQKLEGAITFAKWAGGSGGFLGLLCFIYELFRIFVK